MCAANEVHEDPPCVRAGVCFLDLVPVLVGPHESFLCQIRAPLRICREEGGEPPEPVGLGLEEGHEPSIAIVLHAPKDAQVPPIVAVLRKRVTKDGASSRSSGRNASRHMMCGRKMIVM